MKKEEDLHSSIRKLTERLEHLNLKFNRDSNQIKEEIEKLRDRIDETENSENEITDFTGRDNPDQVVRIGTSIRIINNYKGQYGILGRVTRLDPNNYWVWFEDRKGKAYRRARINVEILKHDIDYYTTKWNGKSK